MTVSTALTNLQTRLLAVNPTPEPSLTAAYIYPDEHATLSFASLPIAIIQLDLSLDGEWLKSRYNAVGHNWQAEALILLNEAPIGNPEQLAIAQQTAVAWLKPLALALKADHTLNNSVYPLGTRDDAEERLFRYRIGVIPAENDLEYWGIVMKIPLRQDTK